MAEGPSIGGQGSARVGGVHIDMTLQGAEKVKADTASVADSVASKLTPAMQGAEQSTKGAASAMGNLGKESSAFSSGGLAGMLLKLAAVRKAMVEAADALEAIYNMQKSGGDAASKIFSEQGLAGAESRMKAIADQAQRMGSTLANASDVLRSIATLDVSKIVSMFTDPAKLMEEQNRLSILAGKELRQDHEKAVEAQKEQNRERRAEEEMRRIMDDIDEEERNRKEEEAYQRQLARDKIAEAEALEAMEERGRAMARAFEDEMNRVVEDIAGKIQGSLTGITQAGGDMSGVIEVLNRIDRKTERR